MIVAFNHGRSTLPIAQGPGPPGPTSSAGIKVSWVILLDMTALRIAKFKSEHRKNNRDRSKWMCVH